MLVKLADKYDGNDRWYLEAFGIGCTGREKEVLAAWEKDHTNNDPKVAEGIAWRLKKEPTPGHRLTPASNADTPVSAWWALAALPAEQDALDHNYGPDQTPGSDRPEAPSTKGPAARPLKWEQIKTRRSRSRLQAGGFRGVLQVARPAQEQCRRLFRRQHRRRAATKRRSCQSGSDDGVQGLAQRQRWSMVQRNACRWRRATTWSRVSCIRAATCCSASFARATAPAGICVSVVGNERGGRQQ